MALKKDEIVNIDPDTDIATYLSGRKEKLSEKAKFGISATQAQKDIKEGVKKTELDFNSSIGAGHTFLKNLGGNFASRILTDYVGDPLIAGISGISTGEGQEESSYPARVAQNFMSQRMGRREAREIMDAENPKSALAGKVGALGIDVAMPLGAVGKSPAATGALFGFGSSDRSLFEDPMEVAKQTVMGGALGYGIGKVGSKLESIASERKALREFPQVQKDAERAYQQTLANFRSNMGKKLGTLEEDIGKYGISKESMNVEHFINKEIGSTTMAGSREAKELSNFLTSIEKSLPEKLSTGDIQRIFESIELRIAQGVEKEIPILNNFKSHLVATLPTGAAQNRLTGKILPKFQKDVTKVVDSVFNKVPKIVQKEIDLFLGGKNSINALKKELQESINSKLNGLSPGEAVEFLSGGDVNYLVQDFFGSDKMSKLMNFTESSAQAGFSRNPSVNIGIYRQNAKPIYFEVEKHLQNLPKKLESSLANVVQNNAIDASIAVEETANKVRNKLSNSTGVTNPLTSRAPTNTPVGAYNAPQAPQVGKMATRFETQPIDYSQQGKQAFGIGAVGRFLGVPKLGSAIGLAKGSKAGFEGMLRGLTSPETLGNIARQGIREGGIQVAVEQISTTYPSYNRGIILDPQERVQAVIDIENNPDLDLEPKAMLQAYINRGKNLENLN